MCDDAMPPPYVPRLALQSMVRYTEIEKERSRRRQKVLMGSGGMWGGTLKLQMVNAGLIPVKKGNTNIKFC